jgi:hypothetical protein
MGLSVFPLQPGAIPYQERQYRLSPAERLELQRQVAYMEDMGWA